MYAVILVCLAGLLYLDDNTITKEVSYSDFENYVSSGGVKKIVVFSKKSQAEGFLTDSLARTLFHESQLRVDGKGIASARVIADIPSADKLQDKIDQWKAQGVFDGEVSYERESDFLSILWTFGPVLLFIGFWIFFMRRMSGRDGGDTEWMDCTADFTEVTPGTWQIRYKETETKKAGAVTEVTVHEPQKPTPAPTPGIPDPKPTPTPDPSPQPSPDPTPQPPSVTQDPETSKIAGYDIFAVPCGKKLSARSLILTVKGKKSSTALAKIAAKKMTGKKSYKIRIKAYKMNNGKKVYISSSPTYHVAGTKNKTYTNAKKISVSPKKLVLRKGTSRRIKAKIIKQSKKKKLLPKSHGTSLRYRSTNKKIASVSKKGKIKARKKGICYICITALNGVMTQIKVKVK